MHAAPLSLPRHHVPRPRLVAVLRDARVGTIVAGGGYGKTTLAVELGRVLDIATPIVRLASEDEDPGALTARLIATFRDGSLSDLATALEHEPAGPAAAIDRLLEALDASRDATLVVVDEVDRLRSEDCALVERLARHLPDGARLLLLGRALPPSLRVVASEATSLGQPELAFTVDETALVLERAGVREPHAFANRLRRLGDGWPLAVVLAASRLAHAPDTELELERMEAAPLLVSGLLDGPLELLPPGDVDGLRQLALLPRLSVEVAERAAGVDGVVSRATSAGIPLHVSADGRIDMPDPVREALAASAVLSPEVAVRAAGLYVEQGTGVDAVRVLVAAGQPEHAAAAAEALGPRELSRLDVRELRALVASIPPDALERHPRALIHLARACEASADRDLRTGLLERLTILVEGDDRLEREVEAEFARDLVRDGRVDDAAASAESLLATTGADELHTRVRALHVLGRTHAWRGDQEGLAAAEPLLQEAAELYGRLGHQTARAHALLALAYDVQTLGGRFEAAVQTLELALVGLPGRSRLRGVVLVFRSEALIDLGRLTEAEAGFAEAEVLGRLFGDARTLGYTGWLRARAAAATGDAAGVRTQLAEAERHRGAWFEHHTGGEFLAEAALLLDQVGQVALADHYLQRALERESDAPRYVRLAAAAAEARRGDPLRAEGLLAAVAALPDLEARESWRVALLRGWAAHRRGEREAAAERAHEAFELARRMGAPGLPLRREPAIATALLPLVDGSVDGALHSGPPMTVTVLGGFGVHRIGGQVSLPAGRPEALVKLVALRGGRMPTDEAIDALWPDAGPESGRKRLRNVLNRLRDGAGKLVARDGDALVLPEGTEVDAVVFERAAVAAAAEQDRAAAAERARVALGLYAGEVLPDDRYADWAVEPRERLRSRAVGVIDLLVADAEHEGAVDEALRLLERGIELDRLDESRYLHAARLLLRQGRRGRALDVLRIAAASLHELGLEPSPEHRELVLATRG